MLLIDLLRDLENYFILPSASFKSNPSWFGFPIVIKDNKISRHELVQFLEKNNIKTRLIFAGNLTKQPYMQYQKFRVASKLNNSDYIMKNGFWVGIYPGLTKNDLKKISYYLHKFISLKN